MSVQIFKPELWSRTILNALDTITGMRKHSDYTFQGEIKYGHKLHITEAGEITIRDYNKATDITFDEVDGKEVLLEITQKKYFARYYDDVDKAQMLKGVVENDMKNAGKALALEGDKFVAGQLKDAVETGVNYYDENGTADNRKIACSTSYTPAKNTILEKIEDGLVHLYSNNVTPETEIWGEFSPKMFSVLRQYLTELATNNLDLMKRGIIGKYNNVNVCIENLLPYKTTTSNGTTTNVGRYNFLRTGKVHAFAEQIDKVDAGKREKGFGDYFKGLYVFGGVVVKPEQAYAILEAI